MPKGVNPIGGKRKPVRSAAQKAAHAKSRSRTAPQERVFVQDASRTTFGQLKKPTAALKRKLHRSGGHQQLSKGQYEKIVGTRIQLNKGGVPVRVVLESGKEFPPGSTAAAKTHMAKLAKQRAELEEIARMRGDEVPLSSTDAAATSATTGASSSSSSSAAATAATSATAPASEDAATASSSTSAVQAPADSRKRANPEVDGGARYTGTVFERASKKVWVKLAAGVELPEDAAIKLAQMHERRRRLAVVPEMPEDTFPVVLAGKADKQLKLLLGVEVSFSLKLQPEGLYGTRIALGAAPKADASAAPSSAAPAKKGKRSQKKKSPASKPVVK